MFFPLLYSYINSAKKKKSWEFFFIGSRNVPSLFWRHSSSSKAKRLNCSSLRASCRSFIEGLHNQIHHARKNLLSNFLKIRTCEASKKDPRGPNVLSSLKSISSLSWIFFKIDEKHVFLENSKNHVFEELWARKVSTIFEVWFHH